MTNNEKDFPREKPLDTDKVTDEKSQKTNHSSDNSSENNTPEEKPEDNGDTTKENQGSFTDNKEQQDELQNDQQETDPRDSMIKQLEEKNKELNDKYLRLFSDFDNFRKRNIKERLELIKTASAEITEAVLPVLDDLERAYKSATENPDIEALTEGLNLIQTKLKTTLKHKGLEEIPTVGEDFNTDFHEAITNMPASNEKEKGKVIDEVQKGYLLNGKVLRFAKVVVAN
ncbi:MAG: nucleotide exchange factor GrpE [Bacteroidetes bacterium]|nr:MAG: nucleotide exchange factor GrpE [Bacteroidota bacterium]